MRLTGPREGRAAQLVLSQVALGSHKRDAAPPFSLTVTTQKNCRESTNGGCSAHSRNIQLDRAWTLQRQLSDSEGAISICFLAGIFLEGV